MKMIVNVPINDVKSLSHFLRSEIPEIHKKKADRFFKTKKGDYAEHDLFLNIPVPILRSVINKTPCWNLNDLQELMTSPFNEERLTTIFLIRDYIKKKHITLQEAYHFYENHIKHINNWNLVDQSAPYITGPYCLLNHKEDILFKWAKSDNMWVRRIAIVSSLAFVKNNNLDVSFDLAKILMTDSHDLIHKATGWILREAGKKDEGRLISYIREYKEKMPKTMYRYAIERLI